MLRCKALWLAFLLTLLFVAVLRSAEPQQQKPAATKPAASAPATQPKENPVVAVVNGEQVMLSELLGRLNELNVIPEKREEVAAGVLDGIIDNALLVQFLAAQKVAYDTKAVDAQIAEAKAEYEKEGIKFADGLAQLGLTEQKLRASVIAEVRWQNYLTKNVTDKQLADYFAKYPEYFDGTEVRASHILVEVAPDVDEKTRAAAKEKVEKIRKEIVGGLRFPEAAQKYSDCPSKEKGGDVDFFPRRDKMVEPFAKVAFALKIFQLSNVVETEFGYHLVIVTERKPGTRTKLDDPALRKDLLESVGDVLKEEIVAKQRKVAKIEIAPGVQPPDQPKAKTATQPTGKTKK
jgi:parvulin-like peptidyl-prolyl isomerase